MDTISQALFNNLTASRAPLACIARIHKNHRPAGTRRLVGRELHKLIPRYVANASIKFMAKNISVIAHHVFDVEFFKGDYLIFINNFTRKFMSKISSFVINLFMNIGKLFALLFSIRSTFIGLAQSSLGFGKFFPISLEKAWIINLFASRKSCEGGKANIDTDNPVGYRQRLRFNFARETGIPFVVSAADSQGLDDPFYIPVEIDFDTTNLGNLELILNEIKPALGKGKTIIPIETSKARIPWSFACFCSAKESPEGKINSHCNILETLRIGISKKWIFFFPSGQNVTRIISGNRFFSLFPGFLSDLKCFIVYPAASIKRKLKSLFLFRCRIESIFVCFTHSINIFILTVKVKDYFKERARLISPS